MEQKQIFGVILGVIVCIVMLFAGLYLTGQIGKKKNVVPAAAEVQTTETTDTTMTAAETTAADTTTEAAKNAERTAAHDLWRKDDGCRGFDCLWIQCLRLYFR